jgi:hypothetical protein
LSRRRGFRRLTFVIWLLVSGALFAVMNFVLSPPLAFPFRITAPDGSSRPEVRVVCLTQPPPPGSSTRERLRDVIERTGCDAELARLADWEASAAPAFRTEPYWASVRRTALVIASASVLIWGLFFLLAWVAAGFRDRP